MTITAEHGDALEAATDLETIGAIVKTAAGQIAGSAGATFVLRDGDKCFYTDEDAIAPLWKGQRFPLSHCISGWAMLHDEPAVVRDVELDERIPIEAYRPGDVRRPVRPSPPASPGPWSRRWPR